MEVVDGQIHLPRLVTDWRAGHPRWTNEDATPHDTPGIASIEAGEWDTIITATLTAMDAAGVNALVIDEWLGQDAEGYMAPSYKLPSGLHRYTFEFAAYAASRYPERFSWLARVNPLDPEVDDVVAEFKSQTGMRILRVDPLPWLDQIDRFAAGGYAPVFESARKHDLPVYVWSNGPYLPNLEQYLRGFSDVQIVIDHMGTRNPRADATHEERYGDFATVFELGRQFDNLAIKWSTVESGSAENFPWTDMFPYLQQALDVFGRERILWASDWSEHQNQATWAQLWSYIHDSGELSTSDKEWILGRTLRTILRWPAVEGCGVGEGKYFDCSAQHPSMRVSGRDDAEFLANMWAHYDAWHPHHRHAVTEAQLLGRARG